MIDLPVQHHERYPRSIILRVETSRRHQAFVKTLNIYATPNVLSELMTYPINDPATSQWEFQAVLKGGRIAGVRPAPSGLDIRYQPAKAASPDESPEVVTDNCLAPTSRYTSGVALERPLMGVNSPVRKPQTAGTYGACADVSGSFITYRLNG